MRLIQHKREAYWFYRFLSLGYDRWVNPLFWTAGDARPGAGARRGSTSASSRRSTSAPGTGFTTEGIVERSTPRSVTMLDQSPHQLARAERKPALAGVPQAARRRRGAAVRRRRVRPLRVGRLDRVLAGAAARDRRGLPRAAGRAASALVIGPVPPGRTGSRAGWRSRGCCSRARREYREWFERAGFDDVERAPRWRPTGTATGACQYAVAVSGRQAAPGRRRWRSPARREDARRADGAARAAARSPGASSLGSLAGFAFVPVALVLTLRARWRAVTGHAASPSPAASARARRAVALLAPAHDHRHDRQHRRALPDRGVHELPGLAFGGELCLGDARRRARASTSASSASTRSPTSRSTASTSRTCRSPPAT